MYAQAAAAATIASKLLGGSDHERVPIPTPQARKFGQMDEGQLTTSYQNYLDANNLSNATSQGGYARRTSNVLDRIRAIAANKGIDLSSITGKDFAGDPTLLNQNDTKGANQVLARYRYNTLLDRHGGSMGGDRRGFYQDVNRSEIQQAKAIEAAAMKGLTEQIDPSLAAAQQRMDAQAGTNAVSAGDEQALMSRLAAQIRTSEQSRLAQVGASMGLGNMSNSPAAAALASRAAQDATSAVTSAYRDTSLQVNQMNREQARMDNDLATRIAALRYQVRAGNSKSLIGMQGDVAATLDALYSRDQSMQMAWKSYSDSKSGSMPSWVQPAIQVAGVALAPFTGGASLAVGAGLGAAAGKYSAPGSPPAASQFQGSGAEGTQNGAPW